MSSLALRCAVAFTIMIAAALWPVGGPMQARAAEVVAPDGGITLEVGKGRVISLEVPVTSVFVADPEIADVQAQSPTLLYLFGRRSGSTTVFAVDENQNLVLAREVVVEHDLARIEPILRQSAPDASFELTSMEGGLILSGAVAEAGTAETLARIAERFLGEEEELINRLVVTAPTQVSLRVQVAELSREVFKLFGINLDTFFTPGDFLFGLATGRPFLAGETFVRAVDQNGTAGAIAGGYQGDNADVRGIVDALERENLVTILAEPNLTALSGETASFLAGGEFPVPVGVDDNDIQIEFKEFGVSLAFTPTVLSPNRISLRVRPEVSEISETGAIRLNDLVIPALATRRAETTVELGSGQSFAIGGLISNSTKTNLEKFPGLGDLPVLGPLFRSTSFQRNESELVIIVTPYLVRPAPPMALQTSVDGYAAPTDLERILRGDLARAAVVPATMRVDPPLALRGDAGFILE